MSAIYFNTSPPLVYTRCPVCSATVCLVGGGKIRQHNAGGKVCAGSGETETEAVEVKERLRDAAMDESGYALTVTSDDRLVEIKKADGTVYHAAIGKCESVILCTCKGHLARGRCKHQELIQRALATDGIPFRAGGRLMLRVGLGLVDVDRPDPFERL